MSTDHTERPWLLFIDIDAKDVALQRATETVTNTATKSDDQLRAAADITDTPPAGYEYTFADIDRALEYGFQVHDILTNKLQLETVVVQYSGQGCHVLGLDADPANRYDEASRETIVKMLTTRYEIPLDEKCTTDKSRFTRLPYSLHADVSRIVTPIDSPDFDYRTDAQPDFLTEPTASVSEQ